MKNLLSLFFVQNLADITHCSINTIFLLRYVIFKYTFHLELKYAVTKYILVSTRSINPTNLEIKQLESRNNYWSIFLILLFDRFVFKLIKLKRCPMCKLHVSLKIKRKNRQTWMNAGALKGGRKSKILYSEYCMLLVYKINTITLAEMRFTIYVIIHNFVTEKKEKLVRTATKTANTAKSIRNQTRDTQKPIQTLVECIGKSFSVNIQFYKLEQLTYENNSVVSQFVHGYTMAVIKLIHLLRGRGLIFFKMMSRFRLQLEL